MKIEQNSLNKLLPLVFIIFFSSIAYCILPPSIMKKKIYDSEIKGVAKVVSLNQLSSDELDKKIEVEFEFECFFDFKNPENELKENRIIDSKGKIVKLIIFQPLEGDLPRKGGPIFYQPEVGKKYFVTGKRAGDVVTSLTEMNQKLEAAIKNNPASIEAGMTSVYVKD